MERSTSGILFDGFEDAEEVAAPNPAHTTTTRIVMPFQGSFRDGPMVRRNGGWEVVKTVRTVSVPKDSHQNIKKPTTTRK